jgi:hypothetical protein
MNSITTSSNPLLTAALAYARRGWHVFPCHTPTASGACSCRNDRCGNSGKHPRTRNGVKDATTDPARITHWWTIWPDANLAIATGVASGIFVLDEDSYKGGDTSLAELQHTYTVIPDTPQQLTGNGGVHYFFTHPGSPIGNSVEGLGRGLDIRSDGGYVIAPPSLHRSGKTYRWEVAHDPEETPLATLPAWLLALCQQQTHGTPQPGVHVPEIIHEGHRNDTLFRLGASLRAKGLVESAILAALVETNAVQCVPPLDDADIRRIAQQASQYTPGKLGIHQGESPPLWDFPQRPRSMLPQLPERIAYQGYDFQSRVSHNPREWLNQYIAWSQRWSPRAASGFHEAIGLWVLSVIAARRIGVEMGSPIYSHLFIALCARSTLYAKSTTAKKGIELIDMAGCRAMLASAKSTPQALIRSMSGPIPKEYGMLSEEDQAATKARLAFAGQRGWYHEEWGGLLRHMTRTDSAMAEFHSLLRQLDDGYDEFTSETIMRGMERIKHPYLALLSSATPHDLAPFMTPGSPWWHDGFWPRFAFICPREGESPSLTRRPMGKESPHALVAALGEWNARLGIPHVDMRPGFDEKGKSTGAFTAIVSPLPWHPMVLDAESQEAFYLYNEALLTFVQKGEVCQDYDAWYGRLHEKALHIAMLLTSLNGSQTITMPYWVVAQEIAERWRVMFHTIGPLVEQSVPMNAESLLEGKVERYIEDHGQATARDLVRKHHLPSSTINTILRAMVTAGKLRTATEGQRTVYFFPQDEYADEGYAQ